MTTMETRAAQVAVISCDPNQIEALKIEVEAQLSNCAATIHTSGVSLKRQDGCIVVEVVAGLPLTFVDWLKNHPRIKDSVIYDVPSIELELLAMQEAQELQTTRQTLAELARSAEMYSRDENNERETQPDLPLGVLRAVAELEQWMQAHHYMLVPYADGLRLVSTQACSDPNMIVIPAPTYTFTLTFPIGHIAVLEVRGAADQDSARAIAGNAVKHRRTINTRGEQIWTTIDYTVTDGDETRGAAAPFYLWCSKEARERQPHPRYARERGHAQMLACEEVSP